MKLPAVYRQISAGKLEANDVEHGGEGDNAAKEFATAKGTPCSLRRCQGRHGCQCTRKQRIETARRQAEMKRKSEQVNRTKGTSTPKTKVGRKRKGVPTPSAPTRLYIVNADNYTVSNLCTDYIEKRGVNTLQKLVVWGRWQTVPGTRSQNSC